METTLKLTKADAVKLYPTAAPEFKVMLETSFGKNVFSGKITDLITSLADCLSLKGLTMEDVTPYITPENDRQDAVNGFEQAITATEVINEGWIPDWDSPNERKWQIYWDMQNNGLVFDCVSGWYAGSHVGSRLCFKSAELAKWAASQQWFVDLCKKFMVRKPA